MAKKWTSEDILHIARSYQLACVLAAAADLDIFSLLYKRPITVLALAKKVNINMRAATILLDALAAMELVIKQGDVYSVSDEAAELLTRQSSNSILPMIRHTGNCLRRWAGLSVVLKTGKPADCGPSISGQEADLVSFIGAMHNSSGPIADRIIDYLQPLRFDRLLDIGCASGTWTIAFLKAVPEAKAILFDLPAVIPLAEKRINEAGLYDRVTFIGGDFYIDDFPTGVDIAWLGAICHQNSRERNRKLFTKVCNALRDNGALIIRDVVMNPSHTSPVRGALFAVNMLVSVESGGTYSFDEYRQDLCSAGFNEVELVKQDEFMNSLIRAKKIRK